MSTSYALEQIAIVFASEKTPAYNGLSVASISSGYGKWDGSNCDWVKMLRSKESQYLVCYQELRLCGRRHTGMLRIAASPATKTLTLTAT